MTKPKAAAVAPGNKARPNHGRAANLMRAPWPEKGGKRALAARQAKRAAAAAPVVYAPGFFTSLVRMHDFPPRWCSQWNAAVRPDTSAVARANREAGKAFGGRALWLAGSVEYVKRWGDALSMSGQAIAAVAGKAAASAARGRR